MYRTWIELDAKALEQNVNGLRSLLGTGARFCAVVKANAYGHGLKEIVPLCVQCGVDAFAVDDVNDALWIRSVAPDALVLVIGYVLHERLPDAVEAGLDLLVYDAATIARIEELASASQKKVRLHLKVDTGTTRQGVLPEEIPDLVDRIARSSFCELSGLATHFANLEDADDPSYASEQLHRFERVKDWCASTHGSIPPVLHSACSAGIILYPQTHFSLVRAGISLYGYWPSEAVERVAHREGIPLELQPVLTWKTRLVQIKDVAAGTPVGYGLTERTRRRSRIGVLPIGYFDGYDRVGNSSKAEVLIGGHRCKILGRICMNLCMADVTEVPHPSREQEVVILGRQGRHVLSVDTLAGWADTISYEILARLPAHLPRVVTAATADL